MIQQLVSPVLVGRDEELSRLEDALLAANRGGSRFVALAGEAGIGKTRLCLKLQERAHKLGLTVMSGGCSEADLALPYLPLLEALGNFLATEDPAALGTELGAARRELAQLFPQLAAGRLDSPPGDPTQAKMRLFESIVALLSIPARRTGLLLVVEDIHWADASSRELLDYISRRVRGLRVMVVVTYRDDELHRRHPLVPTLQGWRRSGLVVVIELGELTGSEVGQMIAAILDADELSNDFRDLMHHHSEGNPFVLEEMLKEALDRGDIYRTGAGWERKSLEQVRVPDTVRDTILLRVQRLEPAVVHVLEAASVLGRVFDYQSLVASAAMDETAVQKALEVAVREQLAEEDGTLPGRYQFRHGLTQEAIYSEILVPRRQEMHSRAADALATRGAGTDFEVAFHLLGAHRHQEAVPACARGAEQAIRLCAFGDAVALYERLLEHVEDAGRRAEILCKMGEALWLNGQSVKAERHLDEGIKTLEALGDGDATAHFLITRGRCRWEASKPDLAARDYEAARAILEPQGPSYDLALVYLRIAGLCLFELDAPGCIEASERAVAIARDAGSVEAHAWALGFLALGQFDIGQLESALQTLSDAYGIAKEHGAWWIASNHAWNEVWVRTHAAVPGAREALGRLQALDFGAEYRTGGILLARSYVRKGEGELAGAADDALEAVLMFDQLGLGKMGWRAKTAAAEVLVELGRVDEARRHLPEISTRSELQDIVYDSRARVRCAEAAGDTESAAQAVRTIVEGVERLAMYRFLIGLAVEVLVAQGDLETADVLVGAGRNASVPTGMAFVDQAAARIALARGNAGLARSLAQNAIESMSGVDCALDELRTRVLLARALLATGERDDAASQLQHVVARADGFRAALVSREARSAAEELGIPLDERGPSAAAEATRPEEIPTTGERLVTVMFADVRGYTAQSAREAPAEMADRIGTMQRWAKQEVERHHGMVDKFAGDAVMATFNVSGAAVDHCLHALEAALAVRDKGALMDLELGIGIAVGPAIVGALVPGANVSVLGDATNLAARLQALARGGELLLSAEAFKRVGDRVRAQDLGVDREELSLKGFDGPVAAYRVQVPWRHHHRGPAHGPTT